MNLDDAPDLTQRAPIFRRVAVQSEFLAGIASEMEDDRVERVVALKMSGDAGDGLTRTKIDPFLHLVPTWKGGKGMEHNVGERGVYPRVFVCLWWNVFVVCISNVCAREMCVNLCLCNM